MLRVLLGSQGRGGHQKITKDHNHKGGGEGVQKKGQSEGALSFQILEFDPIFPQKQI